MPGRNLKDPFGQPLPAYNRGAMCQGRDGRLYWVVAYGSEKLYPSDLHLLISTDGGRTWKYSCRVAWDDKVEFNETSLYETPKGDLVALIRTAKFDDHTVIARSTDGGKLCALAGRGIPGPSASFAGLPDNRVWLVYGYRHKPYGIRARILDAECTNASTAAEIVLREDGGSGDLGYPWSRRFRAGASSRSTIRIPIPEVRGGSRALFAAEGDENDNSISRRRELAALAAGAAMSRGATAAAQLKIVARGMVHDASTAAIGGACRCLNGHLLATSIPAATWAPGSAPAWSVRPTAA